MKMPFQFKSIPNYNGAGTRGLRPAPVIKPRDIKMVKKRTPIAPPERRLKPYRDILRVDFTRYLKVVTETVVIDDVRTEPLFIIWTGSQTQGLMRGATYVDTWEIIDRSDSPPGCTPLGWIAIGSIRTPYAVWIEPDGDFELNAMRAIMRVCGFKRPKRYS